MLSISSLISVLISFFYLVLIIITLAKRNKYQESTWIWLLLYLVVCLAWNTVRALIQFKIFAGLSLQGMTQIGLLVATVILLPLTRSGLRDSRPYYFWLLGGLAWLGLFLGAVFAYYLLVPGISLYVLLIGWLVFLLGITQTITKARRMHTLPFIKARNYYWSIGVIITTIGSTIYFGNQSPEAAGILYAIGTFVVASTLISPYMPDIRQLEQEILNYLVMTLLTALILILGALALVTLLNRVALSYHPTLIGAVIAFVIAALLAPLWIISHKIAQKLLPQFQYYPDKILREYSQAVSSVLDPELLSTIAVRLISEKIEIQRGYLFLAEHELEDTIYHYRLHGTNGMSTGPQEVGILADDSPVALYFRQDCLHLRQTDLDLQPRFKDTPVEELSWLKSLGVDIYIPIYAKEEWMGLIALGPKLNGLPYFEKDLDLLTTLADQTAVALQNAKLVESLMRLNNDFRRAYASMEQANQHLQKANSQLEGLDRTKSEFISVASHELRTPLTVIRGYNEMLLDDPNVKGNPFQFKLVSGIFSGIMRMNEIISSMLDIASIDTRSMELQQEQVDIDNLVKLVSKDLSESLKERNLILEIDHISELPSIDGDTEALRKVLYHILVNAIKYTPDNGKIYITGATIPERQKGLIHGGIEIIISDTGIGISKDNLELIFTKFYQTGEVSLHSTGKTKYKGAGPGLGLAIAKGIVDAHRGQIWAESPGYDEEKCPGSAFHIVLPLHYTEEP